jgi:ferredoxin-NADP reductase
LGAQKKKKKGEKGGQEKEEEGDDEEEEEEEDMDMEEVVRPYTPFVQPASTATTAAATTTATTSTATMSFELLVKAYRPSGRLSVHLADLSMGKSVAMRGPMGGVPQNWLQLNNVPRDNRGDGTVGSSGSGSSGRGDGVHLVLVGAGTGITPALQLLYGALGAAGANADGCNSTSSTTSQDFGSVSAVTLLTCNRTEADIPLRAQVDALDNSSSTTSTTTSSVAVKVVHALSSPLPLSPSSSSESGTSSPSLLAGRVSADMLRSLLLPQGGVAAELSFSSSPSSSTPTSLSSSNVRLAWCGPEGFNLAMRAAAAELGLPPDFCHEFG